MASDASKVNSLGKPSALVVEIITQRDSDSKVSGNAERDGSRRYDLRDGVDTFQTLGLITEGIRKCSRRGGFRTTRSRV